MLRNEKGGEGEMGSGGEGRTRREGGGIPGGGELGGDKNDKLAVTLKTKKYVSFFAVTL